MSNPTNLSAKQQIKAAYALNMCTVSVSQIIDYQDTNILDQEYNAILNNLNLEEMPKDDALLRILKHLLDVITHFKISEMDRQVIEAEYQQKMKNAIWAAVPNFGMILAGGSPLTMAVSLVNQVGIGYMNYRRNKADYAREKDRQLWQLRRSAIEQFNFIRTELFSCAWQLEKTYEFPDSFRLTEQQINEYNQILRDPDSRKRYERFDSIQHNFEAYPSFWYFFGNTANSIANDLSIPLSDSSRWDFRRRALAHFEKFEQIEQRGLLREDILSASCALEHVDLLLLEKYPDQEKVNTLISKAIRLSGSSADSLQLCAITCLKIGRTNEAVGILRNLVNKNYNPIVNAQMLSAIYVNSFGQYQAEYELLASRVDARYLFPRPREAQDIKQLGSRFEATRKEIAKQKAHRTLERYVQKNEVRWNAILSTFEVDKQYPDGFFSETETARLKRKAEAERIFHDKTRKEDYQKRLLNAGFISHIQEILNEMTDALFASDAFSGQEARPEAEESIKREIRSRQADIERIQSAAAGGSFQLSDYIFSQHLTLDSVIHSAITTLTRHTAAYIDRASAGEIAVIESGLLRFCTREGIDAPDIASGGPDRQNTQESRGRFGPELFGHKAVVDQKNADFLDDMVCFVSGQMDQIIKSDGQVELLLRGEPKFNGYFRGGVYSGAPEIEAHAVTVLHDLSRKKTDLVFTTDGILPVLRGKAEYLTPYLEVSLKDDKLLLFRCKYDNKSVDMLALASLLHDLGTRFARDLEDYVEYIPGVLTVKLLLDWFRCHDEAMSGHTARAIAVPSRENLEHFGYFIRSELDMQKNIMQCCYDRGTGSVFSMRIVRGEGVESKLQSLLLENGGILYVGR